MPVCSLTIHWLKTSQFFDSVRCWMCSLDDTCISQLHEYIVFKKLSGKIYIREKDITIL